MTRPDPTPASAGTTDLREAVADGPSPEEIAAMRAEAEAFRQPAPPPIPVRKRFYMAGCKACGWIGSSEQCGSDSYGDDSDVYCPVCCAAGCDGYAADDGERAEHGEAVYQRIVAAESRLATLAAENEALRKVLRDTLSVMHNADRRKAFYAAFDDMPAPNDLADAYAAGAAVRRALTPGGTHDPA